jgi:hypothetical protein
LVWGLVSYYVGFHSLPSQPNKNLKSKVKILAALFCRVLFWLRCFIVDPNTTGKVIASYIFTFFLPKLLLMNSYYFSYMFRSQSKVISRLLRKGSKKIINCVYKWIMYMIIKLPKVIVFTRATTDRYPEPHVSSPHPP